MIIYILSPVGGRIGLKHFVDTLFAKNYPQLADFKTDK